MSDLLDAQQMFVGQLIDRFGDGCGLIAAIVVTVVIVVAVVVVVIIATVVGCWLLYDSIGLFVVCSL